MKTQNQIRWEQGYYNGREVSRTLGMPLGTWHAAINRGAIPRPRRIWAGGLRPLYNNEDVLKLHRIWGRTEKPDWPK